MKKEIEEKYVVVTVVSSFRQRYVIPTEELQKLNEEVELDELKAIEWAEDSVTCENVKEFSQQFLGENIIDTEIVDTDSMLKIFDKDNKYLSEGPDGWDRQRKLNFIHQWKENNPRGRSD